METGILINYKDFLTAKHRLLSFYNTKEDKLNALFEAYIAM